MRGACGFRHNVCPGLARAGNASVSACIVLPARATNAAKHHTRLYGGSGDHPQFLLRKPSGDVNFEQTPPQPRRDGHLCVESFPREAHLRRRRDRRVPEQFFLERSSTTCEQHNIMSGSNRGECLNSQIRFSQHCGITITYLFGDTSWKASATVGPSECNMPMPASNIAIFSEYTSANGVASQAFARSLVEFGPNRSCDDAALGPWNRRLGALRR